MKVRMRKHIGGYRDGVEWPEVGDVIDVPDDEAAHLIAAGYADEHEEPHADESAAPADPDPATHGGSGAPEPADPDPTGDTGAAPAGHPVEPPTADPDAATPTPAEVKAARAAARAARAAAKKAAASPAPEG